MDIDQRLRRNRVRRDAVNAERTAATEELEDLVIEAIAHDMSAPQIAELAGITRRRVYQARDRSRK